MDVHMVVSVDRCDRVGVRSSVYVPRDRLLLSLSGSRCRVVYIDVVMRRCVFRGRMSVHYLGCVDCGLVWNFVLVFKFPWRGGRHNILAGIRRIVPITIHIKGY